MKKLLFILRKEFRQIFRDKMIMQIIFVVPILQMLLLPWAADMDVRTLKVSIVDSDNSTYSRLLTSKISASHTFDLYSTYPIYKNSHKELENEKVDIIISIPIGFERDLIRNGHQQIAITADAINSIKSGLGTAYLRTVIQDFNQEILADFIPTIDIEEKTPIQLKPTIWFNSHLDFKYYMVPAILVLLVTVTGMSLSSLNIVKEKEIGTIEQLNVSPVRKGQFILGKLIPFWIVSLFIFLLGMIIMRYLYGIPILGSPLLLFLITMVYLISILGLGLLISTFSATQQQAMFLTFFFLMIFILMSGLFTIVKSMPLWARIVADGIPITHYMRMVRSIVLKGSSFADLYIPFLYLIGFGIVANVLAVLNYKKTN